MCFRFPPWQIFTGASAKSHQVHHLRRKLDNHKTTQRIAGNVPRIADSLLEVDLCMDPLPSNGWIVKKLLIICFPNQEGVFNSNERCLYQMLFCDCLMFLIAGILMDTLNSIITQISRIYPNHDVSQFLCIGRQTKDKAREIINISITVAS